MTLLKSSDIKGGDIGNLVWEYSRFTVRKLAVLHVAILDSLKLFLTGKKGKKYEVSYFFVHLWQLQ